MKELRGREAAERIAEAMRARAEAYERRNGRKPCLAIVRCGAEAEDLSYERSVMRKAEAFGVAVRIEAFPKDVSDSVFQADYAALNETPEVDGILLMRPLPEHLNEGFLVSCMNIDRDVDGVSPFSAAGIYFGTDSYAPCTAEAVMDLLHFYEISVEGKEVVILGRSDVVGKPLAMLMLSANATVTVCHSRTREIEKICSRADILISAIGKPHYVTEAFLKPGAIVIDVGMSGGADGKMHGDVDFAGCCGKAAAITPVPGGVGQITTAVLLKHVVEAAEKAEARDGQMQSFI